MCAIDVLQVCELVFSLQACDAANHYVDGLFFGNVFTLLAVMMVYKYWDSLTREDLEFCIAGKTNPWEDRNERNPLLANKDN